MTTAGPQASWLTLVGMGAGGPGGLTPAARDLVARAEILVGGRRHLAWFGDEPRRHIVWRSPLIDTLADIEAMRGRPIAVLASGDPLWFGIGRLLVERFGSDAVTVHPHVSAFQLAAAHLRWALEDVVIVSLHGRPIEQLRRHLHPGARLLCLSSDGRGPAAIAALLCAAGMGDAIVRVLERLGGNPEGHHQQRAGEVGDLVFDDLNIVAIELPDLAAAPSCIPGLPDEAFAHDGQLTKSEVRAVTISRLAPRRGELLWDIGAGAGSIAIEWLRADRAMRAIAIERDAARAERIGRNALLLGVPELQIVNDEAPAALEGLPDPHAIFVGAAVALPGLLDRLWSRLPLYGRLVANAVTTEAEAALMSFQARHGGVLARIAIARAEPTGSFLAWRALRPVTQLSASKTCDAAG